MFDTWYWVILERNENGRFFAHVPDLPGATAGGASEKEVLRNIAEIAADHIRDAVENGEPVPPARTADDLPRDAEVVEYGRAAIPVDIPGKSVKISLSVDEAVLNRADRAARQVGMSRSGFFANAVQQKTAQLAIPAVERQLSAGGGLSEGGFPYLFELRAVSADKVTGPGRRGRARSKPGA